MPEETGRGKTEIGFEKLLTEYKENCKNYS